MNRFRYLFALLTTVILLVSALPAATAEDLRIEDLPKVAVTIDGTLLDADAYIVNGRTVVPLRAIFNALGATVEWDGATRTVTATKGAKVIKLTIDKTEALVGDKVVTLAVPALIINARTFVPVRFVSEALDAAVSFDSATRTVIVDTGLGCTLVGGQKHTGTIKPGGETWGLCGSPHIVSGTFIVEGKDSPVLTIEAGALVQFENGAWFRVGRDAPGGLLVNGTADKPVTLTSAAGGAKPGDWRGIYFYTQTLKDMASIQNATIEYAGGKGSYEGALYIESKVGPVAVTLNNVTIRNSLQAGLWLWGNVKLSDQSGIIKITGTTMGSNNLGYPVITDNSALGSLPGSIELKDNALNGVYVYKASTLTVKEDLTLKNLGVPYVFAGSLYVEGDQTPVLTIQPGTILLFPKGESLVVGFNKPGTLIADATAGDAAAAWSSDYKPLLEAGLQVADGKALTNCPLCATNKAIVFGTSATAPSRGAWAGIRLQKNAGQNSKLIGAVVNWGGDQDYRAGIYAEGDPKNEPVKVQVAQSMFANAKLNGIQLWGNAAFAGFTGNTLTKNGTPLSLYANVAGTIDAGNEFTGNDVDEILLRYNTTHYVAETQTWRSLGVPYRLVDPVYIAGTKRPVLTLEPGVTLLFNQGKDMRVGEAPGNGSLVAVGTADKPITFTSDLERPGAWRGLNFTDKAGNGNRVEYAVVKYADTGIYVKVDLGAFIKDTAISDCTTAIGRGFTKGTDYATGFGNTFQNNGVNQK